MSSTTRVARPPTVDTALSRRRCHRGVWSALARQRRRNACDARFVRSSLTGRAALVELTGFPCVLTNNDFNLAIGSIAQPDGDHIISESAAAGGIALHDSTDIFDGEDVHGEARSTPSSFAFATCTIDHVNIRGFISHRAKLEAHLLMNCFCPYILSINESFLERAFEEPCVSGFELVGRRDRSDDSGWGIVLLFALASIASYVCLLEVGCNYEAVWATIHSDIGAVLLCAWYRLPPPGDTASIDAFEADWERFSERHIGIIVVGDLNLHHNWWLKYSTHVSVEGSFMYKLRTEFRQLVRGLTRNEHLLDAVITDLEEAIDTAILPSIADHNLVRGRFALRVFETMAQPREVFLYRSVNWSDLRYDLNHHDWNLLSYFNVDVACERLTSIVDTLLRKHVPTKLVSERASTHPWINARCNAFIRAKQESEGSPGFTTAAQRCSEVLMEEYLSFTERMK